ncbi:MAG: iron-containing alcohol dehydrogenase [Planctomycetota bacterium]|jgi:alcohol dehydrogenase|nr:iron-containing alcohol dehydrogenase [Blastopirellula sp.]
MTPFDFQLRTRIVFGAGSLNRLGELAVGLGARRALLVTDRGLIGAGHVDRAVKSLGDQGVSVTVFAETGENPTTEHVAAGVSVARQVSPELLVGLGGGSSLDCAKGINFIYTNGGEMKDYWGVGKATQPMLPMIAVPTTGGTGSELQSFALISDAQTHMKMACGDRKASCAVALLDPELTLTQPRRVTAVTGIDAISHAVETYVTRKRNPVSLHYSREAWRLLSRSYARVLEAPDDLEARAAMQLGAAFAGLAIENSMLGAAHSLANPVTASRGTIHGQAVGIALPHVVRFNGAVHNEWYVELLASSQLDGLTPPPESGAEGVAEFLGRMLRVAGLATSYRECGVGAEELPELARQAAAQWTAQFNPREVQASDLERLYEQAL